MPKPITTQCTFTLVACLLIGGCASKQVSVLPEGGTVTDRSQEQRAKDPNPGPVPSLSLSTNEDLWPLLRSGYAVIAVSGAVMSNEATPAVKDDQPSEVMAELKDLVTTQSQSSEVQIIGDILAKEYEVLQVVPATSNPIARLAVGIDLSGPQADGARLVRTTLSVSYEMSSRSGEGLGSYGDVDVESERYDNFREAVRASLAAAFKALEEDKGLPGLPL